MLMLMMYYLYCNLGEFSVLEFIDIDTDHRNPQMCCTYASEIYTNQCVTEVFFFNELLVLISGSFLSVAFH